MRKLLISNVYRCMTQCWSEATTRSTARRPHCWLDTPRRNRVGTPALAGRAPAQTVQKRQKKLDI